MTGHTQRSSGMVRLRSVIPIGIGLGAIVLAVTLDALGLGGQRGFGTKEVLLVSAGLALVLRGMATLWPNLDLVRRTRTTLPVSAAHINLLGAVSACCYAAYMVMSYGMAPLVPFGQVEPHTAKLTEQLAEAGRGLGSGFQQFISGQSALAQRPVLVLAYVLPIAACTAVFLILLVSLARHSRGLSSSAPRLLYRWATVYGAITALACPVLVLDFWYPIAWGRMVVAGHNPYYYGQVAAFVQDLPLAETELRMMYGPLWALGYSFVAMLAGDNGLLAAALIKLLLLGAWIGSLRLIWAILQRSSLWQQCVGIAIYGWLPISVMQSVGDGHNDTFMVFFLLLWLYALQRQRFAGASLALAGSVLIKYATLPLFALDLLHLVRSRGQSPIRYLRQAVASGGLILLVGSIFYRSPEFFAYLPETSQWHFYTPREAALTLFMLFRVNAPFVAYAARAALILVAVLHGASYIQRPDQERFHQAVLAVMCAMLFSVSSHMWPWYSLWILAVAALVPGSILARWALGVAMLAPFPMLVWVMFPEIDHLYIFDIPALALYTYAALWLMVVPHSWFPRDEDSLESVKIESPNPLRLGEVPR